MLIELVQMVLASSLLGIGVLLFAITRLAQKGIVINLMPPIWLRWVGGVVVLMILVSYY